MPLRMAHGLLPTRAGEALSPPRLDLLIAFDWAKSVVAAFSSMSVPRGMVVAQVSFLLEPEQAWVVHDPTCWAACDSAACPSKSCPNNGAVVQSSQGVKLRTGH